MMKSRSIFHCVFLALSVASFLGCSSGGSPILPSGPLTPEQEEKIRAQDKLIDDEESQGSLQKPSEN